MSLGGPQKDRSKMLAAGSNRPSTSRDDILSLDRGSKEYAFEGELGRLRRENATLKDQLNRSLKELKAYQNKYPSAYIHVADSSNSDFPSWASSPDIMKPLFESYDVKIKELESIVNHQAEKLKLQTGSMEGILAENEELRDIQLAQMKKESEKKTNINSSQPLQSEVIAEMTEKMDALMAENATLLGQRSDLSASLEKLEDELNRRTDELERMSAKLQDTSRELKNCAIIGIQTETERDEAAKEAVALSDALGKLDGEMEVLREQVLLWQNKSTDANLTIKEMQKAVKQADDDKKECETSYMRKARVAEDRARELAGKLQQKSEEHEQAQEMIRKLRREYQSTRQDAEGMLQVMSGLERQVSEYSSREAEVEKKARESRQEVEAAMTSADSSKAREELYQREIERLIAERKQFHEKRQLALDEAAETARNRSMEQVRTCEAEMRSMAEAMARMQQASEQSIREGKSSREIMEQTKRLHEDEVRNLENALRDARDALATAIINKEEEAAKKVDIQESNKELRGLVDKLRLDMDALQLQLNAAERSKLAEVAAMKTAHREVQKSLTEKARAFARKASELDELKADHEAKVTTLEKRLEDEVNLYRLKAQESEKLLKDMDAATAAENQRSSSLLEQLKDKTESQTYMLESALQTEADNRQKSSVKLREVTSAVEVLKEEKAMLVVVVEEARSTISDLQADLMTAKNTILDLTESLSESHNAREEASNRASYMLLNLGKDKQDMQTKSNRPMGDE